MRLLLRSGAEMQLGLLVLLAQLDQLDQLAQLVAQDLPAQLD
jgi:hypothetical protein